MNKVLRIILSILLAIGGVAVLTFAIPLLRSLDIVNIGAFLILAALGTVLVVSGVRIARGERMRDVLSDLFRGIGR